MRINVFLCVLLDLSDEKSANNVLLSNKMSLGKYGVILGRYENEFRENSIIGNEIGISIDFDAWKIYEIFDEQPYYNNCFCNNIISNLQNVYSRTASSYYNAGKATTGVITTEQTQTATV